MGFMDKLMFWKKKKDDSDLFSGDAFGQDPFGKDPFAQHLPNDPLGQQGYQTQQGQQHPFGFGSNPGVSQFGEGYNQPQSQFQNQQDFYSTGSSHHMSDYGAKDLELISVKLDSIRTTLESINQRLSNLERQFYDKEWRKRW